MKTTEEIFMEVQDIECPNLNNLTLPEDWQLKAMKLYANQKLDEAAKKTDSGRKNNIQIQGTKENKQDIIYLEGKIKTYKECSESILSLKDKL